MSTETAALVDAFRLVNVGVGLGVVCGMFFGWVANEGFHWLGEYLNRRAHRIDPRDVL